MWRFLGVVFAGTLLFATAGCTLDSFFLGITGSSNHKEQTVGLSVSQVSTSLRATLGNMGLMVTESRDGEAVHLKGQTRSGRKFDFILQRQKSDLGERTVIAFEGEKEAEDMLWMAAISAVIAGPAPVKPLPTGGAGDGMNYTTPTSFPASQR